LRELKTEFLFEMSLDLEKPQSLAPTPYGDRHIYQLKGGTFEGPKLKGEVLAGGGDWLLRRPDGVSELDVRATLRTDDGHLIYTYYRGVFRASDEVLRRIFRGEDVDLSEYYLRATPVFETASEKYSWLNQIVSVGIGEAAPNWIGYTVYALL
jgi:hypothetical protein